MSTQLNINKVQSSSNGTKTTIAMMKFIFSLISRILIGHNENIYVNNHLIVMHVENFAGNSIQYNSQYIVTINFETIVFCLFWLSVHMSVCFGLEIFTKN